jgi:hypothetical protein
MPADGISLPPKRDFGTSRWGGSKVRLHQRHHRAEGLTTAYGTSCSSRHLSISVAFGAKRTLKGPHYL